MQIRPTWSDYGTHDASAYPELWRRCIYAACPSLGPTGNKLIDLSLNNRFGTLTNMEPASDWVISDKRYALSFDGTDERVVAPYSPSAASTSVSVSCWFYRTSSAVNTYGRGLVARAGSSRSWLLYVPETNDNWLVFLPYGSASYDELITARYESSISNNAWHHAVARLTAGTQAQLWLDGSLVATATNATASIYQSNSDFEIGSYADGFAGTHFQGYIDDVMVWDYGIPDEHIRTLYRGGRGIAYTPRIRRKLYSTGSQGGTSVSGTVAVTLDNVTSSASGTGGTSTGVNRLASVSLSQALSAPFSIG